MSMDKALPGEPLSVYVHWPFCESKCPYCDFNSHVRRRFDAKAFLAAYLRDIDYFADLLGPAQCTTIFFGGGTPSLMPPETVAAVIEGIRNRWPSPTEPEITLEANPSSVETDRFRDYRSAGVNRLSLGVQSLRDESLSFLGRLHDAETARVAMEIALSVFPRVSFDLIYARPGQTPRQWKDELREVLGYRPGHLSLYQLTIEPGTAFYSAQQRDALTLPDEETALALYDLTQEQTLKAGLPAYEVSNHARPGEECRHNLAYWTGGQYVGVGPGAHGRFKNRGNGAWIASAHRRSPEAWLKGLKSNGGASVTLSPLSPGERRAELLLMGLRLAGGIDRDRFAAATGAPLEAALSKAGLARAADAHLIRFGDRSLAATPKGLRLLDHLLADITA